MVTLGSEAFEAAVDSPVGVRAEVPAMRSDPAFAHAILHIDLSAVIANWRLLRDRAAPAECAAVVKADAYGLGAGPVASALAVAGCRVFFVATLNEGIALRATFAADELRLPTVPAIFILGGTARGAEMDCMRHGLIPVLNSLGDIDAWRSVAGLLGARLPAALHIDTGMSRLGLPASELAELNAHPDRLQGIAPILTISHLACADEPAHPLNALQAERFRAALAQLPAAPASFANSSGILLGEDYRFDLVRPGIALYGGNPVPAQANPMRNVVRLLARVLQVREIDTGDTVGYGATHRVSGRRRIATVGIGYADGFLRSLSNRGAAVLGGERLPIVGRVSMDLVTLDATDLCESAVQAGDWVELIGPHRLIDDVAADAGTIGYEILTSLGQRYARIYVPAAD